MLRAGAGRRVVIDTSLLVAVVTTSMIAAFLAGGWLERRRGESRRSEAERDAARAEFERARAALAREKGEARVRQINAQLEADVLAIHARRDAAIAVAEAVVRAVCDAAGLPPGGSS